MVEILSSSNFAALLFSLSGLQYSKVHLNHINPTRCRLLWIEVQFLWRSGRNVRPQILISLRELSKHRERQRMTGQSLEYREMGRVEDRGGGGGQRQKESGVHSGLAVDRLGISHHMGRMLNAEL